MLIMIWVIKESIKYNKALCLYDDNSQTCIYLNWYKINKVLEKSFVVLWFCDIKKKLIQLILW